MTLNTQTRVDTEAQQAIAKISKRKRAITAVLYIGALILGAILGFIGNENLNIVLDFIATVFTRLFSFIAVPVIAVSLINTLARLNHGSNGGTIFSHTIFYTLLTTIIAAAVGLSLFLILAPSNVPQEMLGVAANPNAGITTSYFDHIVSIIPNNFLQPFVSGNVLSILLVAAAVGLGIAAMPTSEGRTALVKVLTGLQDLLFILIHWLIAILPLGIVAFTAQLVTQLEAGVILGGLATYFATVISSNILQMFIFLPLLLLIRGLNPLKVARGMLPALMVALFSKSSAGTLPVTIASAEDNLNIDKRISRFVLPICTTINMNGCAAFILITSLDRKSVV